MSDSTVKPSIFECQRRVEFSDTDMAGIMHFSNFYKFMETTEHAFFRSIGHGVHETYEGYEIGWPRVQASCEFFKPVRFEDIVTIRLSIEEIRRRSVRYAHQFFLTKGEDETLVASGLMTTACVRLTEEKGRIESIEIPDALRSKLEKAVADS